MIIINVENSHISVKTSINFVFHDSLMNRKIKTTAFILNRKPL